MTTEHDDALDDGLDHGADGVLGEHLTELTLEMLAAGEAPPTDDARRHLDDCLVCHRRLAAIRDHHDATTLTPPAAVRTAAGGDRGGNPWLIAGGVLALAAGALVFALQQPDPPTIVSPNVPSDGFRLKGGFDLEIFEDADGTSRRLDDGSAVTPGRSVGFRVSAKDTGYLLIAGVDGAGAAYPVYPQDPSGKARKLGPSPTPQPLDQAIAFDATPGSETLIALFCADPIFYGEIVEQLPGAAKSELRPDCMQRVIRLKKSATRP